MKNDSVVFWITREKMIPSEISILDGIGLTIPRKRRSGGDSHSDGGDGNERNRTLLHLLIVSYCIYNRK
jgi:hypothetical protein